MNIFLCLTLVFLSQFGVLLAQGGGSCFSSRSTGLKAESNVYEDKDDIYLNAGPTNCSASATGLDDGDYYFQVTDNAGTLLSTTDDDERRCTASSGKIVSYAGRSHSISKSSCGTTVQLAPYKASSDGNYKLHLIKASDYKAAGNKFLASKSKVHSYSVTKTPPTKGLKCNLYASGQVNTDKSPKVKFSKPVVTTVPKSLDFKDFKPALTNSLGQSTYVAATFTGQVYPNQDGSHTFSCKSSGGVRIHVDGKLEADGWDYDTSKTSSTVKTRTLKLTKTGGCHLHVEYYHLAGTTPSLQILWDQPGASEQVLPVDNVKPVDVLNAKQFGCKLFAALDNSHYDDDDKNSQIDELPLPAGWSVASKDDADAKLAAQSHNWGCHALATAEGASFWTGGPVNGNPFCLTSGAVSSRTRSDISSTQKYYKCNKGASTQSHKILIFKPALGTQNCDDNGTPSTNNTVIYKGKEFATLDGAGSDDAKNAPCSSKYSKVPAGWNVADNDDASKIVATAFKWGASSCILKDGTALETLTGKSSGVKQLDNIKKSTGEDYYRGSPKQNGCQRVLISRATTKADTYKIPAITQTCTDGSNIYAVLDNTAPVGAKSGCQSAPLPVPTGWAIVTPNGAAAAQAAIDKAKASFGCTCLLLSDGSGFYSTKPSQGSRSCGGSGELIKTNNILFSAKCSAVSSRVLISKPVEKVVISSEPCPKCTSWGDPHITTYDGASYNWFGLGQYYYVRPLDRTVDYAIVGNLSVVKTASCNTDLVFSYDGDSLKFTVPANSTRVNDITITRNGNRVADVNKETCSNLGACATGSAGKYTVTLKNGISATVTLSYWNINMMDLTVTLPSTLRGKTEGLCGTCGNKTTPIGGNHKYDNSATVRPTSTPVPGTDEYGCSADFIVAAKKCCQSLKPADPTDEDDKFLYEACLTDVCSTGDCHAAKPSEETKRDTTGDKTKNDKDNVCEEKDVDTNKTVTISGRTYAALDFSSPSSTDDQETSYSVPSGWLVADDTPLTRSVITCSFGSTCMTLRNGLSLNGLLSVCANDNLASKDKCFVPANGIGRILLIKDLPKDQITDSKSFQGGSETKESDSCTGVFKASKITVSGAATAKTTRSFGYSSDQGFSVEFWYKTSFGGSKTPVGPTALKTVVHLTLADGTVLQNYASTDLDVSLTSFTSRSVDVIPPGKAKKVDVDFILTGYQETVTISDCSLKLVDEVNTGNLLKNSDLAGSAGWIPSGSGFTFKPLNKTLQPDEFEGSGTIQLSSKPGENISKVDYGAKQIFDLTAAQQTGLLGIYFRGDCYADGVGGVYGAGFSLYVDIGYNDGTSLYGLHAPCDAKKNRVWQSTEKVFILPTNKKVKSIQFVALLRYRTGTVNFDKLFLTLLYCNTTSFGSGGQSFGTAYGDPHLVTLDGHPYDNQAIGDFVLFQDPSMSIITRSAPAGQAAVLSIARIVYNDQVLTWERNNDTAFPLLTLNGQAISIPANSTLSLPNLATVAFTGTLEAPSKQVRYDLLFPASGHSVTVTAHVGDFKVQWLQVFPFPPVSSQGLCGGLLGNFNGDKSDDWTSSNGDIIPLTSTVTEMYTNFVATWRLDNSGLVNQLEDNKLPDVKPPVVPAEVKKTDFPAQEIANAEATCQAISDFDSCVLDVLMTGDHGYRAGYDTLEAVTSVGKASASTPSSSDSSSSSNTGKIVGIVLGTVLGSVFLVGLIIVVSIWWKDRRSKRTSVPLSSTAV